MTRLLSIPLLLATCALCFVAGYKLGNESQPPAPIVAEIIAEQAPILQLTDTSGQSPLAPAALKDEPIKNPFALRADETLQTFFDKNERTLIAQILEVKADSLKIRRQADGVELELPVAMLSTRTKRSQLTYGCKRPRKATHPRPADRWKTRFGMSCLSKWPRP